MWKIVRWQFTIALMFVLLAAPFALAQQKGVEQPDMPKPPTVQQLRDALNTYILSTDSVSVPMPAAIRFVEDGAMKKNKNLVIDFDSGTIKRWNESAPEIDTVLIKLTKRERPVQVKVLLQEILDQFDEGGNVDGRLTFAIVGGRVLIGPHKALLSKMLTQPVTVTAEGEPLRRVLKQLTDQTGVNLVLETQGKDEPKVTLDFQELPLNTAINVLAEVAGLSAVRIQDHMYLITTKERANRLRKEQGDWSVPPAYRPLRDISVG
jgi:hypothetical protein